MKKNLLLLFLFVIRMGAQEPFNCDYNAYLFQYNDVYAIDLASGSSYVVATDITPGNINGAGYNPTDGYIWGSLSTPSKTIVRIGKDFSTTTFYIDEFSSSGRYIGDVSVNGVYYLKGGGTTYYTVDVDPASPNYGTHIATGTLSQSLSIHDWAFNAVDGKLYTVEKNSNKLYRIDPDAGTILDLGEVPILSGLNYTYGAVYFDASGRFYVSANQTGTIYVIQNVQDLTGSNGMDSNLFAFGPSSSSNDGARCPTAPVPQEDCINGVDDDGDGLVDCDDPSCSGQGVCPVIEPPTSGGDGGGLESNNRLSELINKRNFNRAKRNHKFDKSSAKRVLKLAKYGKKTSKGTQQLSDFIPLTTINEDLAVESTPSDLLNITNATDIYSVDYMRDNKSVATVLVLKTENGVYEHTKYICDRLLGAELLSVSTIQIRDHSFIRALIKNTQGGLEFALSLSAKPVNNNANFDIESHWNLDGYEANVPYYNFQIWSNSLDDLLRLGEEVVRLLEVQKSINTYNSSSPPTVFVKKGTYNKGKLDLQIINTNRSEAVNFNAGVRTTETYNTENITSTLELDGSYITNVELDAGNLFDIGFRIGDGVQVPDDLFISDGAWGYDDTAESTQVTTYNVEPNKENFEEGEYPIERNIELSGSTGEYVSVYRALTPRYHPIDLTTYKSLQFKAKGTGTLSVSLIKDSINNWGEHYKKTIVLTDVLEDYSIPFTEFTSTIGEAFNANDITTVVFTMHSETGGVETKDMSVQQLRFSESSESALVALGDKTYASPNPMGYETLLHFRSKIAEPVKLYVYNQIGGLAKKMTYEAVEGKNEIKLDRIGLNLGLYFCQIKSNTKTYDTIKLLIE